LWPLTVKYPELLVFWRNRDFWLRSTQGDAPNLGQFELIYPPQITLRCREAPKVAPLGQATLNAIDDPRGGADESVAKERKKEKVPPHAGFVRHLPVGEALNANAAKNAAPQEHDATPGGMPISIGSWWYRRIGSSTTSHRCSSCNLSASCAT